MAKAEFSKSSNISIHNSIQERSSRNKRSLFDSMPLILTINIKLMTEKVINLKLTKKWSFLANKHLPIVTIDNKPFQNVMKAIGGFVIYHDFNQNSAFIYYKKTNSLSGVIGLDYTITNLPLNLEQSIYLSSDINKYIKKHEEIDNHIFPEIPNEFWDQQFIQLGPIYEHEDLIVIPDFNSNLNLVPSAAKRLRIDSNRRIDGNSITSSTLTSSYEIETRWENLSTEPHYLEILVVITRDTAKEFENKYGLEHYIQEIIKHIFNYFNAVDMLIRNIRKNVTNVYMNIAKIIIDNGSSQLHFGSDDVLNFSETVINLREYFLHHKHIYTPDSFDHVFVFTSLPIEYEGSIKEGMTDREVDLYEARKNGVWYLAFPITVISDKINFALGVHEISRTFDIKLQSWDKGFTPTGQCHSIMQSGSSKCTNCLKWSESDAGQLAKFFVNNRNRCFLLNQPRSLRPPKPSKFLSPVQQCKCFGYQSYSVKVKGLTARSYVLNNECNVPLKCQSEKNDLKSFEHTLMPFDGTYCIYGAKVCWNGQCMKVFDPIKSKS